MVFLTDVESVINEELMIQSVRNRNHYDINFKAEIARANNSAQKACACIAQISQISSVRQNILALDIHGIEVSPVTLSKSHTNEGKIHLCYKNKNDEGYLGDCINLADASTRKVETLEDAKELWDDIIRKAWIYYMDYAKTHYDLKIN